MGEKRVIISRPSVDYLRSQLDSGVPDRTKRALQHLCKLYRSGHRISPDQLNGVEQTVVGILYTQRTDEKVRRWALNALARFGRPHFSFDAVVNVLKESGDNPQIAAAAIAAAYKMKSNAAEIVAQLGITDPQVTTLAALQHIDAAKTDLSSLPINIETATPDVLRLGLVVVGLNRAPPNLFHPRHSNAEIVRALGGHHDGIVIQYTVWAVVEHPKLGIEHLGIPLNSIEARPANVRGWLWQLIAMSPDGIPEHLEMIAHGAGDSDAEARLGLALGLRDTYYDGIEPVVLDWYFSEADLEVQQTIMDHIVRHGGKSSSYDSTAYQIYEAAAPNSIARQRMEAHAADTVMYAKFRQISYDGSGDLFRSINIMNTTNIHGGIQAGAVSVHGNAKNSGETNVHYQPQTIEAIQGELSKAVTEIHKSGAEPELKEAALQSVRDAQANPTPDRLAEAVSVLGKIEAASQKAANVTNAIGKIGEVIASLSSYLPPG